MNSFKILRSIFFIFICNFTFSQTNVDKEKISQLVDEYLAPFEKHDLFNGSVLIMKGDKVVVNKGYGYANYEHKVENAPNTRFRIASISKIFTKLSIIQLIENNLLSLDDNLSKFISDYPNGKKITVQHLLNHSSGIPHLNDFNNYDRIAKEHYTVSEVIELFKNKPLDFEPGTKETYSNSGYVLLVYIIEKLSGLNYDNYLNKNIFQPAGMENSGHDSGVEIIHHLANGYMMNLRGKGLQKPLYYDPSIKIGGGSLYSTTQDLYAFQRAYGEGKLSQSTKPLYNQGTYGKSPGYSASIWGFEDIFIIILSNNYSTPIKQVALDLMNLMRGKDYKVIEINEDKTANREKMFEYEGNFKIDDDIETIEKVNDVLIEYENGDKWRGCRLIPLGGDAFFDTCYLEKLTFLREKETNVITGFVWQSGDKTIRISEITEK